MTRTMPHFPALESARLVLRAPKPDDKEGYDRLHRDPTAEPWIGDGASAADRAIENATADFEHGWCIRWSLVEKSSNRFIGFVELHEPRARAGILSYAILQEKRCQGFAAEAIQAILGYVATQPHMAELIAHTHASNHPSAALLQKLGFEETGEVELPGGLRREFRRKVEPAAITT